MKNLSAAAKLYITGIILIGLGLIGWMAMKMDWARPGLYVLAVLGAVAQTLKVEGTNSRTNYSIALFVYGFAFIVLGPLAAMFVIVVAHLVEWAWHKYPWYIQAFNIGNHVVSIFLAGIVFAAISGGLKALNLNWILGL